MSIIIALVSVLLLAGQVYAQSSSHIEVYTFFSENGKYYLKSIPFDASNDGTIGITHVYQKGNPIPLYQVDRYFQFCTNPNTITLSNDGKTIFYVRKCYHNEQIEAQKSITVYQQGKLVNSYTIRELTECTNNLTNCELLYTNEKAVDYHKDKWEGEKLILGFQKGTSKEEQFAMQNNLFSKNDTVYLIAQDRKLKKFDVKTGELISSIIYNSAIYHLLRQLHRDTRYEIQTLKAPSIYAYPPLVNGNPLATEIAQAIDMKVEIYNNTKYKLYYLNIEGLVDKEGKLKILKLYSELPVSDERIKEIVQEKRFIRDSFPAPLIKWKVSEFMTFRKKSDSLAIVEKKQEEITKKQEYERRSTLDSINGFYIPKNLKDCFLQLDVILKPEQIQEIKKLPTRRDAAYHRVGNYIADKWELSESSRLQKYFFDKGYLHHDSMSTIILAYYHDWLNGKTETWKEWEEEHKNFKE